MSIALVALTSLGVLGLLGWLIFKVVTLQKQLLSVRPSEEYLEGKKVQEQALREELEELEKEYREQRDRINERGVTASDWVGLYAKIQELKNRN